MNGSSSNIPDPEDQALTPRFLTSLHDLEVLEQDSIRIQCRVGGRPPRPAPGPAVHPALQGDGFGRGVHEGV